MNININNKVLLLLEGVLLVLRRVLPVYLQSKAQNKEYITGLEMGMGILNKRTQCMAIYENIGRERR